MLVRPARLPGEIRQHLFGAGGALPLVYGCLVQAAQRMFDALHRPDRVLRVELRLVDAGTPDEQLRQAFFIRADEKRCPPAPAQDLEAAERAAHLQGQVVAP